MTAFSKAIPTIQKTRQPNNNKHNAFNIKHHIEKPEQKFCKNLC